MQKSLNFVAMQTAFQDAVLGKVAAEALVPLIVLKPPVTTKQRLAIYQDAYRIRLTESLEDDFNECAAVLGSEAMAKVVDKFIDTYPSTYRNLAEYSAKFPPFIAQLHPQVGELALREWLSILSLQGREPEDAVELNEIEGGTLYQLALHPASHVGQLGSGYFLSYRLHETPHFKTLSQGALQLLQIIKEEPTLADLTQQLQHDDASSTELAATIHDWLSMGIIYCKRCQK
ncbi:MAG: DUF2063 domain-containing protein [Deltaproteobacteria bacterium]|nr:DUF2063 domain-containing protein [Deltaproteobacteria bacterium]